MQIERSPSRWPYGVALTLLLVFCLTIPSYWLWSRSESQKPLAGDHRSTIADIAYASARDYLSRHRDIVGAPTAIVPLSPRNRAIERALAQLPQPIELERSATRRYEIGDPELLSDFFDQDSVPAPAPVAPPKPARPGRIVSGAMRFVGWKSARMPTEKLAIAAVRLAVIVHQSASDASQQIDAPQIRLSNPRDRLALLPAHEPSPEPEIVVPVARSVTPAAPPAEFASPAEVTAELYAVPWSTPTTLIRQLETLAHHPYSTKWAEDSIEQLQQLSEPEEFVEGEMTTRLHRLRALAEEATALADNIQDDIVRAELLRAHWGLTRRLECWELMHEITIASAGTNRFAARAPDGVEPNAMSGQGTETVDLHAMSTDLEAYERSRTPRLAQAIVERQRQLAQSSDPRQRALAGQIEENYRNSNVRVAISAELLSRFVQQPEPEFRPVHDIIAGTPVHGQSQTFAENRVRLQPATGYWQLGIEADGVVESKTVADGGQAKLHSRGSTHFSAHKSIVVATDGVHVGRSAVGTQNRSRLVGVRSSCDWVPVVGDLVRHVAVDKYWEKQPRAQSEVEYKVARQVEEQFDSRTGDAIKRAEQQIRDRLIDPLEEAGIVLTPVELTTTTERVVARLRLAGDEQLAGHTPRPRAPADSLASLQVHESALTNAALALELNGTRQTAPELQQLLRDKIPRLQQQPAMDVEPDTLFHFADRDAVRFRVAEGKLEIILALIEVRFEGQQVRNFRVHAFYRPVTDGIEAELVRDGALGIEGRLRTADRARMHGVFNKVLSEDRSIPVIRLAESVDSRFADLMITQLVLEDGWLGLAVGPTYEGRTAERSRMLR